MNFRRILLSKIKYFCSFSGKGSMSLSRISQSKDRGICRLVGKGAFNVSFTEGWRSKSYAGDKPRHIQTTPRKAGVP
jgi:hypothetical protein